MPVGGGAGARYTKEELAPALGGPFGMVWFTVPLPWCGPLGNTRPNRDAVTGRISKLFGTAVVCKIYTTLKNGTTPTGEI